MSKRKDGWQRKQRERALASQTSIEDLLGGPVSPGRAAGVDHKPEFDALMRHLDPVAGGSVIRDQELPDTPDTVQF